MNVCFSNVFEANYEPFKAKPVMSTAKYLNTIESGSLLNLLRQFENNKNKYSGVNKLKTN